MKKTVLNLGKALNKAMQQTIHGGFKSQHCSTDSDCCNFEYNVSYGFVCNSGACVPGIFGENPCGL